VDIVVPEAELIRRLASRRICSSCGANAGPSDGDACRACGGQFVQRTDDNEGVVRERLRVYRQSTRPVLDYYRDRPTFREVDGTRAPERVTAELDAAVDEAAGAALREGRS
jgi:adenylate kinase